MCCLHYTLSIQNSNLALPVADTNPAPPIYPNPLSVCPHRTLSTQNAKLCNASSATHLTTHLQTATFYMTTRWETSDNGGLSLCGWLRKCTALEKLTLEYRTLDFHRVGPSVQLCLT